MLKKIISKLKKTDERNNELFEYGFHGDLYTIRLVDFLISTGVDTFIETGANVGSTLAYVAKKYQEVECLSCEPDKQAFSFANKNIKGLSNIRLYNLLSQDFLNELSKQSIFNKKTLFWLDAHGYGFEWPLKSEIEFITSNFDDYYILIDDFKIPGNNMFGYDEYKGQICSYDYIKSSIRTNDIELYYPGYQEQTSKHHSLRGWGLLVKSKSFEMPESINSFMSQ